MPDNIDVDGAITVYKASHPDWTEEEITKLRDAVEKVNTGGPHANTLLRLGLSVALMDDGKDWPEAHRELALESTGLRKPQFA